MLELVRLVGFGQRRPHQLSGGQQQRVALARALATHPSLVLLDEPLSALDAKLRHELRAELKEVLAAVGSTAIVVTHDQEEAMSLGERIFVMNRGAIMQSGRPDDVYWRPATRFVADFMGRTNWIHGSISNASGTSRKFRSESGWEFAVASTGGLSGAAEVCVRPESVEISSGAAAAGAMPGRVADVVTLGAFRHVVLDLASGDRIISACPNRPDIAFARGQEISISFSPEACVLFER
jgi:putative spermidine/putrescine transport system ATP-binding protein/putrescine transport system ATP-binding protein